MNPGRSELWTAIPEPAGQLQSCRTRPSNWRLSPKRSYQVSFAGFPVGEPVDEGNMQDVPRKGEYGGQFVSLSPINPDLDVQELYNCSHGTRREGVGLDLYGIWAHSKTRTQCACGYRKLQNLRIPSSSQFIRNLQAAEWGW